MHSNKKDKEIKKIGNTIISDKVRDYGNDPFFVKKNQQSKEFLEKHGFPKELLEKR